MKKIIGYIFFILITAICFMSLGCESNKSKSLHKTKIGNFILWTVLDSKTEESTDIFKGDDKLIKELYPNGKYTSYINYFVLKMPKKICLIDTGNGEGNIKESLEAMGLSLEDIDAVYLTHIHKNHAGGLLKNEKATFPNAKIYVSFGEDKVMENKKDDDPSKILYKKIEKAYGTKIITFRSDGEDSKDGLTSMASYGHTGGHTIYKIKSKNEVVYILGDIFQQITLQTKNPKISSTTDEDQERAVSARQDMLDLLETEEDTVKCAGNHIDFPGIGKIEKVKDNEYKFTLDS